MFHVYFEVNKLPKTANGSYGNWQAEYGRRKLWQKLVGQALLGDVPPRPLDRAVGVFTRYSSVCPDYDGLVHSFKPILDSLVLFRIISSDRMSCLTAHYSWVKAKRGAGKISVAVRDLEEYPLELKGENTMTKAKKTKAKKKSVKKAK